MLAVSALPLLIHTATEVVVVLEVWALPEQVVQTLG